MGKVFPSLLLRGQYPFKRGQTRFVLENFWPDPFRRFSRSSVYRTAPFSCVVNAANFLIGVRKMSFINEA